MAVESLRSDRTEIDVHGDITKQVVVVKQTWQNIGWGSRGDLTDQGVIVKKT